MRNNLQQQKDSFGLRVFISILGVILLTTCIAPPIPEGTTPKAKVKLIPNALDGVAVPPDIEVMNGKIPGFMRGINLGNGFDAPSIGEWGVVVKKNHFKFAAAAGLDHVRLPVRFSAHAMDTAPYTIDERWMKKVDWALKMAAKYKLNIILDMHHYEEIHKKPQAHMERFKNMWKQIAERYKDQPLSVAFELLNEPCDKLVPKLLNPLMKETFELVRRSNPDRLIFIDGYFWANAEYLHTVDTSYMDENTVVTWHMYQPILFTHQAAPWMGPEYATKGVVFPGPPKSPIEVTGVAATTDWVADWFQQYNTLPSPENPSGPSTVYQHFDYATALVKKTGIRTYLGEFGAADLADEQSRLNYIKLVRKEAERRQIGWAYWDDGGNNKGLIIQTGEWMEVVWRALFED